MRRMSFVLVLVGFMVVSSVGAAPQTVRRDPLPMDAEYYEYILDSSDLVIEQVTIDGEAYDRVWVEGLDWTGVPGKPQIPVKNVLLGSMGGEATVEVLEAHSRTLTGLRIEPSPGYRAVQMAEGVVIEEVVAIDQAIYGANSFYPGPLAEVRPLGMIRDQAVVQLQLYPVQYNPGTGVVRFVDYLRVRVSFVPAEGTAATRAAGGSDFEWVLSGTLANYGQLDRHTVAQGIVQSNSELPLTATIVQSPTLKITVQEDGIYQLTTSDLTNAGLDPALIDPQTIKVTNREEEIPIRVEGEDDGSLDPGDLVLFYGSAISDVYTVENVYWLKYGGANGLRMDELDGTPGAEPIATTFFNSVRVEENNVYWQLAPDPEADHFFWEQLIAPVSGDYPVQLQNLAATGDPILVRVKLHGMTDDRLDPDHHTQIHLNGTLVSDELWNGQIEFLHQSNPSQSLLQEGTNTVRVSTLGDTGALVDAVLQNWFEIGYWDTYVAEGDLLLSRCPDVGTYKFEISGFTGNAIETYDVSDPLAVALIANSEVEPSGGGYLTRLEATCASNTRLLSLEVAERMAPAAIELDEPSDWHSPENEADYVVVTHEDFHASALALAAHREAQGLRVATVKIEDIYDEFNFGIFNPRALRDFMEYAYESWVAPAPEYVVLVGDATFDYKDDLGTGSVTYVPTYLHHTDEFGQVPTDNWFVAVSGDDILPDMFIGRISVRNPSDAAAAVNKIIAYETSPAPGDWNHTAVFVADDDETDFEDHSDYLASLLPGGFDVTKLYASQYAPPEDLTADILDAINQGAVLVNYTGHGNVDNWGVWAGGRIFETSDISLLSNGGKLPFVTAANCLNGYYAHPYSTWGYSLAEEFVRETNKGAIAAWAPTGLGYPSGHRLLLEELLQAVVDERVHELGPATTIAKTRLYNRLPFMGDMVETFVLFGDPATQLNLPPYPTVTGISPDSAMLDASVSTVITGTYFVDGAQAALVLPAEPDDLVIPGTQVDVVSPTQLTATFDLTDAPQGPWDVQVLNTDGFSHRLRDAFAVQWLETFVPLVLR